MCVYVCVYVCVRVYVCVYVCICVYMYDVCVYICVYAFMHIRVIIVTNSHGLSARRCPMPVSSASSNFLSPKPSVYICVCMHNNYMSWGKCPMGKCPTQNGRRNCPGENCPEGNCPGDYCPTLRSSIAKLQICANYSKIPTRTWMIGVLWTWKQSMASPWMTCIVEVRFQNTCRCDKRGEKTHEVYNCD